MADCIFCKIRDSKIFSNKIYEDRECFVILDAFPATKGQALVISRKHEGYIFNLDDETYKHLMLISKKVSKAIDKAFKTLRTCLVIEGFEIPHVHVRLHPAYEKKLLVKSSDTKPSEQEFKQQAEKIKSLL